MKTETRLSAGGALALAIKERIAGKTYKTAAAEIGIGVGTLHKAAHGGGEILYDTALKIQRWISEGQSASGDGASADLPVEAAAADAGARAAPDEYGPEYTPPATVGYAGSMIPGERRILDAEETPHPPPENYVRASSGRYIPTSLLGVHDVECDRLARRISGRGERLERDVADFRRDVIRDMLAHIDETVRAYGKADGLSSSSGNIKLTSHDGMYQVRLERADRVVFDNRIHAAKEYIDRAIRRWSEGAQPQLLLLVDEAFSVDKIGRLNTRRILELTRYDIDDDDWQSGIRAIKDAVQTERTKWYVRLYRKADDGTGYKYLPISLQKTPASEPEGEK